MHFDVFLHRIPIASEAVDWFVENLKLTNRQDAVALGVTLQRRGVFIHVKREHEFRDGM